MEGAGSATAAAQLAMLDAMKHCPCGACGPLLGHAAAKQEELCIDAAVDLYRRATSEQPKCVAALNGLADCLLSMGDKEAALEALRRSVELAPKGLPERYMNLGQLSEGADALRWLEAGVAILREEWQAASQKSAGKGSKHKGSSCGSGSSGGGGNGQAVEAAHALASALCSVAEVYLTDACDEPEAEEKCESAATEEMSLIAPLAEEQRIAEPYVTMASLRLSQQRGDEACAVLSEGLRLLKEADEANPPSFDLRLSCAKLLMEVEQPAEAVELLQALRLEHDDHLEAWYLLGCAAMQAGDASFALHEAEAACAFATSDACPLEEREWLAQLEELREEAAAAAEGEMPE